MVACIIYFLMSTLGEESRKSSPGKQVHINAVLSVLEQINLKVIFP